MRVFLNLLIAVTLSGCASVNPQARIIDGTNRGPMISFSSHKGKNSQHSKESAEGSESESKTSARGRTFDFTY